MEHIIPITQLRKNFFKIIREAELIGKEFIVTKHGRARSVILPAERYEFLQNEMSRLMLKKD